jgi:ATP adenylyltransferase
MMVVMNLFPYNTGHLEVVPVRHAVWLEELTKEEHQKMWDLTKKSIQLIKKALGAPAFNVGLNLGGDLAGGSVLHLHVQIVPRYVRDLGFMEIAASTKVMPQTIEETYRLLKKHISILSE